jgi:hypothetical protein
VNPFFVFSYILLWVLVAVLAIGLVALYNHLGTVYLSAREARSSAGPAEGSLLSGIDTKAIDGRRVLLPPASHPAIVLFLSTTCSLCAGIRQAIPAVVDEIPNVSIVIFCQGRPQTVQVWASDIRELVPVIVDRNGRQAARYGVDLLPFGIAVGLDSVVRARGIVNGYEGLAALARMALNWEQAASDAHRERAHADG